MRFHPARSNNDDPTNYWSPNMACLKDMVTESGYGVEASDLTGNRGIVKCRVRSDPKIESANEIAFGDRNPGQHPASGKD
jgi:hypothetical protein